MSIQEVLYAPNLPPKTLRCENIHISGNMADDDDVITRQFFFDNLPSGAGNLILTGPSQVGAHMKASTSTGILVQESSLVENNTTFDFANKELKTTNNVIANSFSIGGTNQQVLLADGSTAPYFSSSQSNYFLYKSRATLLVPPGTGNIRYSNAVQQLATQIYVSHMTDDAIDIDFYLQQIQIGDLLYLQDRTTSLNYIKYLVTGVAFVPNLYYTFSVTYDIGEGTGLTSFGTNHPIILTSFLNQNLINARLQALETKTRYQDSLITNQTSVNYTLLADTINATAINKAGQSVLTATDLIPYLTSSTAASTYQTLADMANYPTSVYLGLNYLQILTAQSTYLTQANAASTYQPITGMSAYLTTANAASTYTTQTLYNSTNLSNVGSGESLVAPTSLLPNLRVRGLVAGQGITFAGSTSTDVQIEATSTITPESSGTTSRPILAFNSGNSSYSMTNIVATGNGNVGINSLNPGQKLSIEGSGTANEDVLRVNNQGNFVSRIWLRNSGRSSYFSLAGSASGDTVATGTLAGALAMGVAANGAVQFFNNSPATVKMSILPDGSVGIGTTAPAYPLEVNGSAKITTIRDTANSVGTAGQILSSTGSALAWIAAPSLQMAVIRETQTTNTASGVTYTNSALPPVAQSKPRQFNAKTESGLAITLGGTPNWTFTISAAGTYLFEATAMLSVPTADGQTVTAKLLLNNTTLGLGSVIVGDSFRYGPVNALTGSNFPHTMNGIYTIAASTVFRLDHVIVSQYFTPTGGQPANITGYEEVYATLKITKLS